jgi:hypothetical protein
MDVLPCINQLEAFPECLAEARRIITHDGQAAALFWPVQRKSSDYRIPAGFQGSLQPPHIRYAVRLPSEEMECRPVMPDIVGFRRLPCRGVGD